MIGNEDLAKYIAEGTLNKAVAIFPGGFKPPHKGHFEALNYMLKDVDEGLVVIGKKERDGVDVNHAKEIWSIYERFLNKPITVVVASVSPIRTVYEWIDENKDIYSEIHVGAGVEDQKRWSYFEKNKEKYPNVQVVKIPPQFGRISGTETRKNLSNLDYWLPEQVLNNRSATNKIKHILAIVSESKILDFLLSSHSNKLIQEGSRNVNSISDADDGPRFMYGNRKSYVSETDRIAKRLGFQIINYIIPDVELEKHDTDFPKGPPEAVSYFPVGDSGADNAGTNYAKDLRGKPAYSAWKKYIDRVAKVAGYSFLDFLDADESVEDTLRNEEKKSWKYLIEATLKESVSNKKSVLLEGGGAGHLSHIIEDTELTFEDLQEIVKRAFEGTLDIEQAVSEKTDGFNFLITYKNGRVGAARNKTTIKDPMDIDALEDKFKGRGVVRDAFVYAMTDLEKALESIPDNKKEKFFNGGYNFINLEVIYPETSMTIPYGEDSYLQFHGILKYDEEGNKIGADTTAQTDIYNMIKQVNADVQEKFKIIPPQVPQLGKIEDSENKIQSYKSELKRLQSEFGLSGSNTISDYYVAFWKNYIETQLDIKDPNIITGLVNRWSGISKKFRLNKKNIPDVDLLNKVKEFESSKAKQIQDDIVSRFETLILKLGVEVIQNASNLLAANPKKSIQQIQKKVDNAIQTIKKSGDETALLKLQALLKKLNAIGGTSVIAPTEGFVFYYKGKPYKLTGSFTPVHHLLSLIKYQNENQVNSNSIVTEGGNIEGVNSLVPRESLETTVQSGLSSSGFKNLKYNIVGNKNKEYLGDIDIACSTVDLQSIIDNQDLDNFWNDLDNYLSSQNLINYKIVKGLDQFHIIVPVLDDSGNQIKNIEDRSGNQGSEKAQCQIDIMIGDLDWMEKALSSAEGSEYKAVYRNLFLVDILSQVIFNTKDPEVKKKLQINWKKGVQVVDFIYDKKGKKKKLKVQKLTGDMDKLARFLFGHKVNFDDISTFEKAYKLFNGSTFRFKKERSKIKDSFKKTLTRMKLPVPKELS